MLAKASRVSGENRNVKGHLSAGGFNHFQATVTLAKLLLLRLASAHPSTGCLEGCQGLKERCLLSEEFQGFACPKSWRFGDYENFHRTNRGTLACSGLSWDCVAAQGKSRFKAFETASNAVPCDALPKHWV
jgi:hypothetical protein